MTDRRTLLLDRALDLVGTDGMRGLTHRAVDAAAGVPPGSTSNHFRTREALLAGLVGRFVERERASAEAALEAPVRDRRDLVAMFASFARAATGEERAATLARYALLVETAQRPELRDTLLGAGAQVNAWAADLLRAAGSRHPERDTDIVANFVTGLVLHELAMPDPGFDPAARLAALLDTFEWIPQEDR
ncbi:TetR family transcriptional regulator [Nocardioides gansuensis]|uniref:TetR family transcriptional regulator n=1 Tax=Nocardioides gansuensis TaxID=2138300 RepID=A0A2T8FDW4_9ACTN|nr:TetR family transcriptional regulator [Nocardioides gansuensis]PVG83906.1 TetR family transcriptional regulator [Nocardioides gansuensis]